MSLRQLQVFINKTDKLIRRISDGKLYVYDPAKCNDNDTFLKCRPISHDPALCIPILINKEDLKELKVKRVK